MARIDFFANPKILLKRQSKDPKSCSHLDFDISNSTRIFFAPEIPSEESDYEKLRSIKYKDLPEFNFKDTEIFNKGEWKSCLEVKIGILTGKTNTLKEMLESGERNTEALSIKVSKAISKLDEVANELKELRKKLERSKDKDLQAIETEAESLESKCKNIQEDDKLKNFFYPSEKMIFYDGDVFVLDSIVFDDQKNALLLRAKRVKFSTFWAMKGDKIHSDSSVHKMNLCFSAVRAPTVTKDSKSSFFHNRGKKDGELIPAQGSLEAISPDQLLNQRGKENLITHCALDEFREEVAADVDGNLPKELEIKKDCIPSCVTLIKIHKDHPLYEFIFIVPLQLNVSSNFNLVNPNRRDPYELGKNPIGRTVNLAPPFRRSSIDLLRKNNAREALFSSLFALSKLTGQKTPQYNINLEANSLVANPWNAFEKTLIERQSKLELEKFTERFFKKKSTNILKNRRLIPS